MTDKKIEDTSQADGRSVQINTGFYNVQVWGDPEDTLSDVLDAANEAADRAKSDLVELDSGVNDTPNTTYD